MMSPFLDVEPSTVPAIQNINAAATKDASADCTPIGSVECRLATLADIDEAGALAAKIFSRYPSYQVRYYGCPYDEFVNMFRDNFEIAVQRESHRAYVAIDTSTNEIQGYLIYIRVGIGDVDDEGIAPARQPTGAFRVVHDAYQASHAAWLEALSKRFGPHYIGESLGVEPIKRCMGVASALCAKLNEEAWPTRTPVFFTTTCFAMPFYDRWCRLNGYELELDGPGIYIDKAETLQILRCQFVEPKKKSVPASDESKAVSRQEVLIEVQKVGV